MSEEGKLTEGKIFAPLVRFAMLLQAIYGGYVFACYSV